MAALFHGGRLDAAIEKYGSRKAEWLDLSTGINANPYTDFNVDINSWAKLPDQKAMFDLLDAAGRYYGVSNAHSIIASNGTQALIDIIPRVFNKKRVGILSPTYNEHAHVWKQSGAKIIEIDEREVATHGMPDGLDALVLVNPNNPTGRVFSADEIAQFSVKLKPSNGLLIVDEAFCDADPETSIVRALPKNTIVLRSFGKFFGLAGLRLGFAIGEPDKLDELKQCLGLWSVSGPALEIGKAAFLDTAWIQNTRARLKILSENQSSLLQKCGLEVVGINQLFIYVRHVDCLAIYEELAKQNILVRPFLDSSNYLRFGICANDQQLEKLGNALKKGMTYA